MPAVALANSSSSVLSPDGTDYDCASPVTTSSGPASQFRVYVQGILVAVQGDLVAPHEKSGCDLDVSTLSTFSARVSAVGKKIGRIGDMYGDNTITSGSSKVFSN